MTLKGGVDATLLRRALRLVHCLQKERGASCTYVASNNEDKNLGDLRPARLDTDRALKMLERSIAQAEATRAVVDVSLEKVRNMLPATGKDLQGTDAHRVLLCFNTLINAVMHDYILEQTAFQRALQSEVSVPGDSVARPKPKSKMPRVRSHQSIEALATPRHKRSLSGGAPVSTGMANRKRLSSDPLDTFLQEVWEEEHGKRLDGNEPRQLARIPSHDSEDALGGTSATGTEADTRDDSETETANNVSFWFPTREESPENEKEKIVQLLDLLDDFVALKESTGRERAILSCILIAGQTDFSQFLVNDLALEVENQKRRLEQLNGFKKSSLQNVVKEVATLSPFLLDLQSRILAGFDKGRLAAVAYSPEELWNMLTVYIDKLHSLELLIVEELECNAFSVAEVEEDLAPPKPLVLDTRDQALKEVFGDEFQSKAQIYDHVKSMSPESSKRKLMLLLRESSKRDQDSKNSSSNHLSASLKDGGGSTEALPNRLDTLIRELSTIPQSQEWEIDLYKIRFLRRIGQGTAGTTYLGEWEGSRIAVKVAAISEMGLEGWRTEVRALQKLHHPNIIRLLGSVYHLDPVTFCLVLEYCGGGDLSDALDRTTPEGFFFHSSRGIAKGMAYLHARGIIHRDVKPSNVLIDGDVSSGKYEVKVTDFGVSTEYSTNPQNRTAETGTYRWMAPEVIRHENYSSPADVYSYGVLLWQLLTRESPFADKSTFDAAATVAMERGRPPFPDNTPPSIRELIESCWAHDPDERPKFETIVTSLSKIEGDLTEDEHMWLNSPLGHKVYAKPVAVHPKRVQLQIPVVPGGGLNGDKDQGGKQRKQGNANRKRFSLFSRKSSHF